MMRHGESLANAQRRFAGHTDFDLTELGHKQAESAAQYLHQNEKIDVIYSSDLLRAYHTASPVANIFGLPIINDTCLREIRAGEWEALKLTEIAEIYAEDFKVWKGDYANSRPTGGESTVEVYERTVPHILDLARANDGKNVFVSTHATVVRAFIAYARGLSSAETGVIPAFPKNASISIFNYEDGQVSTVAEGMTEHLAGLEVIYDPHA